MRRRLVLGALVLAGLVGLGALAAPWAARRAAEMAVDETLARMRRESTVVANRGAVTVDLAKRSVQIHDVAIDPPPGGSKVRVGLITIVWPWRQGEQLTAQRITLKDVTISSPVETTTIPKLEIRGYSGPERGLVATPGIGRLARSQADIIGQISADSVAIPEIGVAEETTQLRRRLNNVRIERIDRGEISRATVASVSIKAPDLRPRQNAASDDLQLSTGQLVYEGLNLPTVWRFYAGDGAGDRDPLAKAFSASEVAMTFGLRPSGTVTITADQFYARDLRLRALAFPFTAVEAVIAKLNRGDELAPADIRQQVAIAVDALGAFTFTQVGAKTMAMNGLLADGRRVTSSAKAFEIGPYADERLGSVSVDGVAFDDGAGGALSAERIELSQIDASRLADYGARVGRDEVMLETRPTADNVVSIAPRVGRVDVRNLRLSGRPGVLTMENGRIDVNAPLDAVPQRVAMKIDGLQATPAEGGWLTGALRAAAIDRIDGSAKFALTLDPSLFKLTLDGLDARIEGVGAVTAKGSLAKVDPTLAVASGSDLADKVTAVVIEPFRFTFDNDGGFDTLLKRSADKAGEPLDAFRDYVAEAAKEQVSRLFGPPAAKSADAIAAFIRDPQTVTVSISPKTPQMTLYEFISSLGLGPAGVAQTIDITILNKRRTG